MCAAGLGRKCEAESWGLQGEPQKVADMFECLENITNEHVTIMKKYLEKLAITTLNIWQIKTKQILILRKMRNFTIKGSGHNVQVSEGGDIGLHQKLCRNYIEGILWKEVGIGEGVGHIILLGQKIKNIT